MGSEEDWNIDNVLNGFNFGQDDMIERDRVILKNLPTDLAIEGIRHICEGYGKVINVTRPPEKNYAFVTLETAA